MILQRSQIFLTDARTFMVWWEPLNVARSGEPLDDASAPRVGGGEFDVDPVPGKDAHCLHACLAGCMGEDLVTILQLHPIERVRERFDDPPHQRGGTLAHEARKIGLATSHKGEV